MNKLMKKNRFNSYFYLFLLTFGQIQTARTKFRDKGLLQYPAIEGIATVSIAQSLDEFDNDRFNIVMAYYIGLHCSEENQCAVLTKTPENINYTMPSESPEVTSFTETTIVDVITTSVEDKTIVSETRPSDVTATEEDLTSVDNTHTSSVTVASNTKETSYTMLSEGTITDIMASTVAPEDMTSILTDTSNDLSSMADSKETSIPTLTGATATDIMASTVELDEMTSILTDTTNDLTSMTVKTDSVPTEDDQMLSTLKEGTSEQSFTEIVASEIVSTQLVTTPNDSSESPKTTVSSALAAKFNQFLSNPSSTVDVQETSIIVTSSIDSGETTKSFSTSYTDKSTYDENSDLESSIASNTPTAFISITNDISQNTETYSSTLNDDSKITISTYEDQSVTEHTSTDDGITHDNLSSIDDITNGNSQSTVGKDITNVNSQSPTDNTVTHLDHQSTEQNSVTHLNSESTVDDVTVINISSQSTADDTVTRINSQSASGDTVTNINSQSSSEESSIGFTLSTDVVTTQMPNLVLIRPGDINVTSIEDVNQSIHVSYYVTTSDGNALLPAVDIEAAVTRYQAEISEQYQEEISLIAIDTSTARLIGVTEDEFTDDVEEAFKCSTSHYINDYCSTEGNCEIQTNVPPTSNCGVTESTITQSEQVFSDRKLLQNNEKYTVQPDDVIVTDIVDIPDEESVDVVFYISLFGTDGEQITIPESDIEDVFDEHGEDIAEDTGADGIEFYPEAPVTPTDSNGDGDGDGLEGWLIALITSVTILLLVGVIFGIWFINHRRKHSKPKRTQLFNDSESDLSTSERASSSNYRLQNMNNSAANSYKKQQSSSRYYESVIIDNQSMNIERQQMHSNIQDFEEDSDDIPIYSQRRQSQEKTEGKRYSIEPQTQPSHMYATSNHYTNIYAEPSNPYASSNQGYERDEPQWKPEPTILRSEEEIIYDVYRR